MSLTDSHGLNGVKLEKCGINSSDRRWPRGFAPRIFLLSHPVSDILHILELRFCLCDLLEFCFSISSFLEFPLCAMSANFGAAPDAWEDSWETQADV